MEDLLKKAADLFPAYLRDLIALITGPERFVAHKLNRRSPLEQALLFLGISVAINFLLRLPVAQEVHWADLLTTGAFSFVLWTAAGSVIWIGCRIAGGSGLLLRTLVISFYYFGVLEYLMSISALMFVGALKMLDPVTFERIETALHQGRYLVLMSDLTLLQSPGMRAALGLTFLGMVVALTWMIVGWGAYRTAHKLGAPRSFLAFAAAAVIWIPVGGLIAVAVNALLSP